MQVIFARFKPSAAASVEGRVSSTSETAAAPGHALQAAEGDGAEQRRGNQMFEQCPDSIIVINPLFQRRNGSTDDFPGSAKA